MLLRHPVVTATGIICAAGCGVKSVWETIRAGRSGLGPLTLFSSPRYASHLVGEVREDVMGWAGGTRGSRTDLLGWIAAREALRGARLGSGCGGLRPDRVGVALGSTVGGMLGSERFLHRLLRDKRGRFGPLRFHECATTAELCAGFLGALGPCATFSTACSAGAMAIKAAAEWIEAGEADLVLAGGADSLCRLTLNGFGALLLLDPNGCRPFDARRTGISLGEGAAMLVIEAEETARARGVPILARLTGWGASCDAWHPTAPHPDGRGAWLSMQRALDQADLEPADIQYVSAHGTGTPDNDATEAKALMRLFAGQPPPIASVKRFFGHTLAASGAIKAVVCVEALHEQVLPPNLGLTEVDAALGFAPVQQWQTAPLRHVLSNSFGFGGNNVALVFSHPEAPKGPADELSEGKAGCPARATQASSADQSLAVLGFGVVSAAGHSLPEIQSAFRQGGAVPALFEVPAGLPAGRVRVYSCGALGAESLIEPGKRRRQSRLQQMVIVVARRSLPSEQVIALVPERVCVALGTGLGSLNDTAAFLENMVLQEERAPRPLFFSNSVHNSLASQVAIELKLTGLNLTPVQREISFETALWHGARELALDRADLALAGAADELNQYPLAAGMRWGWWREAMSEIRPFTAELPAGQRPLPGEGCAVFALGRDGGGAQPLARVSGIRIGRVARAAGGWMDVSREAEWILETLERAGVRLSEVDLFLTGANGWPQLDRLYLEVAEGLSRLAGRSIPCGAYKQCSGEYHAASAFGFFTAMALVRGDISPGLCVRGDDAPPPLDCPCRRIILYTLSSAGTKGMCCVHA